jgi:GntR family transcriptional repressor for pyruvate dehydrogenase complex
MMDAVQEEHQAIFHAITAGDPDAAEYAAARHLKNASERAKIHRKK